MARRLCLVTGASAGIGQAIARQAAQQGWSIGLNYNQSQSEALGLAEELRQTGTKVVCLQADVSQQSEVQRMFREFDEALGPLHALINSQRQAQRRPHTTPKWGWSAMLSRLTHSPATITAIT